MPQHSKQKKAVYSLTNQYRNDKENKEIGSKCQNSNKFLGFSVKRHDQETVMAATPEDLSYAVQCDLALPSYIRFLEYM